MTMAAGRLSRTSTARPDADAPASASNPNHISRGSTATLEAAQSSLPWLKRLFLDVIPLLSPTAD